jgi:nucleoside-diphosphate-sugar epimerase
MTDRFGVAVPIEAAGQQLGWKPEVDLHGGLRELVAWWRSERSEGVGS